MTSVFPRMSRHATFAAIVVGITLTIALLVAKDLNHKLEVMTASNAGYQKITDTQSTQIKKLSKDLKELTRKKSACQAKLAGAESQLVDADRLRQKELQYLQLDVAQLEEDREELQKEKSQLEVERDDWRSRYSSTLLKLQQQQSRVRSIQMPPSSSSTPKNNILEEPRNAGNGNLVPLSNPPQSPVGAEPPVATAAETGGIVMKKFLGQLPQPMVRPPPRRRKPDPKQGDLDQMVDNVQQDHLEVPGPLDAGDRPNWGLQQEDEEENEADDAADGSRLLEPEGLGHHGQQQQHGSDAKMENDLVGFDNNSWKLDPRQQRALPNGHQVLPPVIGPHGHQEEENQADNVGDGSRLLKPEGLSHHGQRQQHGSDAKMENDLVGFDNNSWKSDPRQQQALPNGHQVLPLVVGPHGRQPPKEGIRYQGL